MQAIELTAGDLVVWVGKVHEYSPLQRRIIYQVEEVVVPEGDSNETRFRVRPIFDLENPTGEAVEATGMPVSGTYLKKVNLLDLATIRLHFDSFIKAWAARQGQEDTLR